MYGNFISLRSISVENGIEGIIFNIQRYSIHDGPGIRTTVFFKGCPGACPWCHNPEGISRDPEILHRSDRCIRCGRCVQNCPSGALSLSEMGVVTDARKCTLCGVCADVCPAEARERVGRRVGVEEVFREIEKDRLFYEESGGGATFSGGEPLMQPEFLFSLLRECRLEGIHTAVDTTGYADPAVLMDVAQLTDLFLYDIKHLDEEKHLADVGIPNGIILDNIRMLTAKGYRVQVRVPLVPGFNDDPVQLKRIGEFVALLPNLNGVSLLPFHNSAEEKYRRFGIEYRMGKITGTSGTSLEALVSQLEGYGLDVKIGA